MARRIDSTIPVSKKFRAQLEKQKLFPEETYEHMLKRLLGLKE